MNTSSKHPKRLLETIGLEAVPKEQRATPWYQFAIIQIAIAANAGNFLIPALAVMDGGLTFSEGVLATSFGAIAGFILVSLLSLPGSRLGVPAQYAVRTMLGSKGARYISSPIRTLTSLYWFSVQTIGGTMVIQHLLLRLTGIDIPFHFFSVPFAMLMVILAIIGFEAVKKATTLFLPLLLIGEGTILYIYFTTSGRTLSQETLEMNISASGSMMLLYASLAFVQYVSGVNAAADMTRYAKSPKHGFFGLLTGNTIGFIITAVIGCASASLFNHINPYISSTNQTTSPLLISIITTTAIISMISINISNAYTGGYSLLNTFSRLSRIQSAVLFGTFGVICSGFPTLVSEAESFISILGGMIIPISAIISSDFLVVKRMRLTSESLLLLKDSQSLNPYAFLLIMCGGITYFLLPQSASPGFLTFVILFVLYPIVMKGKSYGKVQKKVEIV
ncbi:cytosine permease [Halobacillus sp. A1]|uniref:cytosine permease n=1 Tax=Halobacillus sp. A1 TaxID=2880262 RepID=UPI0020A6A172|nr:cytosine permease [Halobacillus sp. A1]MCP3030575.1 cytosine permease [Halobacillus sp. A1]